jgi:hypothetical protein
MLKKLAVAGALTLGFASPANAAICPASLLSTVVGQNPVALQTFIEKICANLDTLAAGGLGGTSTVKIDQTTPGTTNGVQVNAALPAGSNHGRHDKQGCRNTVDRLESENRACRQRRFRRGGFWQSAQGRRCK